jgi:hypothetical protein
MPLATQSGFCTPPAQWALLGAWVSRDRRVPMASRPRTGSHRIPTQRLPGRIELVPFAHALVPRANPLGRVSRERGGSRRGHRTSTVEVAVGAEVDVLADGRLAQPGLAKRWARRLFSRAGRLAMIPFAPTMNDAVSRGSCFSSRSALWPRHDGFRRKSGAADEAI